MIFIWIELIGIEGISIYGLCIILSRVFQTLAYLVGLAQKNVHFSGASQKPTTANNSQQQSNTKNS